MKETTTKKKKKKQKIKKIIFEKGNIVIENNYKINPFFL